MSARNALCLHDLYIHPSNLWKPKPNGASDWIRTMPHFFNSPTSATTPSGCACHPSKGEECTDTVHCADTSATTPSGCACHPSKGGECTDTVHCADTSGAVEKVSSACNRNRLRREYLQTTRRGGLACPPVTRCAYTIYTFIHPIYGNQNQMAQVIGFVRCRTFSTAPRCNHPVRLRLPPLQRRGISLCRYDTTSPLGLPFAACAQHTAAGVVTVHRHRHE